MRKFFFFIFLLLGVILYAQKTYYITHGIYRSCGSNEYQVCNIDTLNLLFHDIHDNGFQEIPRISTGDNIYFKKCESNEDSVYYGNINSEPYTDMASSLTFGSYGSGSIKPIIDGSIRKIINIGTTKTETIDLSSEGDISVLDVYDNEGLLTLARYPNNGFLTTCNEEMDLGIISINAVEDLGNEDWEGAEIVIIPVLWRYLVKNIISYDDETLSYNDSNSLYLPNSSRFFIQNAAEALDADREWYYDENTKILSIKFDAYHQNKDIFIVKDDSYGININTQDGITIQDLEFRNYHSCIRIVPANGDTCSEIKILNNTLTNANVGVNFSYFISNEAGNTYALQNSEINGNTIKNMRSFGIYGKSNPDLSIDYGNNIGGDCENVNLKNTFDNIGLSFGCLYTYERAGEETNLVAIKVTGNGFNIFNNKIINTGSAGIIANNFRDIKINYNTIDEAGLLYKDVGAIYTSKCCNEPNSGALKQINNNNLGLTQTSSVGKVNGIYLDEGSAHFEVKGNTIKNFKNGIYYRGPLFLDRKIC